MDVRNCKSCGKIYNHIGGQNLCSNCMKALEEKFAIVKEFIYNNPGVGMNEVSEVHDVSVAQIKKWIREERLAFTEDSMVTLECENCGSMIRTGRFCKACKDKLANNLSSLYKEPEIEEKKKDYNNNPKMRFLDGKQADRLKE